VALVLFRSLSAPDLREADGLTLLYGFGFRLIYFAGLAVFVAAGFSLDYWHTYACAPVASYHLPLLYHTGLLIVVSKKH
jgi:hypothetical protein